MIDTCIVCGESAASKVMTIQDHLVSKEHFDLVACDSCDFRYLRNAPPEEEAGPYYETEEYVEHSDSSEGIINTIYHQARKWMLKRKHNLVDRHGLNKSILDIGTGTGYFLNYMKGRGFETLGLEISDKARGFGQSEFGLDIRSPQDLFGDNFPKGISYVTFWHVLEHIYNVKDIMDRLHEVLADDGRIVVALPNYKCLEAQHYKDYWNGYDVPRHIWHFTKDRFTVFALRHGFEVERTDMLPLDPFYN